jgi:hypothetical protein
VRWQHPYRQVKGLVAHRRIFPVLDLQGIEERHRVRRLKRPSLLGGDLAHHAADEFRTDFDVVHLQQKCLQFTHRHAPRVHGNALVGQSR